MGKKMPNIVAVLEQCRDDSAYLAIVDLSKMDLSDPEMKQYHDAVMASIKGSNVSSFQKPIRNAANLTGSNVAFNYNSSEKKWRIAIVKPPCHIDAVAEIWEDEL